MHPANEKFWNYCNEKYKPLISDSSVVEFGSMNVNGSVRDILSGYKNWTGVDWRPGRYVDVVSLAHETSLGKFDVVISCSMLEHDPHWRLSIFNMVDHLKKNGVMFLSWGAALNAAHCHHTATDNLFHPLPAGRALRWLEELHVYVHEFWYEGNFTHKGFTNDTNGMGEVCLVGFRNKEIAIGDSHIDELLEADIRD